jgi:pimeloyl-ACP methyl ester carboxylesterase
MLRYIILLILICITIIVLIDKYKRRHITKEYGINSYCKGNIEIIDNKKIFYTECGQGQVILFIHGFMAAADEFKEVMQSLSKGYRLIAVDLIGFGRSEQACDLDYSKQSMGNIIYKLMIKKGIGKFSVVGHSMGGEVALNLACNYQNNIHTLILVDSVGYKQIKRPTIPTFILEHVFKMYFIQKTCYKFCFYDLKNYKREKFERIYSLNCKICGNTLRAFSKSNDKIDICGRISKIEIPTLIIWGRYDRVVKLDSAYRFNKEITHSKLVIFEKSGHMPYSEEEEKFTRVITEFIMCNTK